MRQSYEIKRKAVIFLRKEETDGWYKNKRYNWWWKNKCKRICSFVRRRLLTECKKNAKIRNDTLFVIERARAEDAAASALTEAVLAFAKENGFGQLNLEVRSDNARAIRLYEKYGFRKLCTFPNFFKIDGESIDFDLMNLELTPAGDQQGQAAVRWRAADGRPCTRNKGRMQFFDGLI